VTHCNCIEFITFRLSNMEDGIKGAVVLWVYQKIEMQKRTESKLVGHDHEEDWFDSFSSERCGMLVGGDGLLKH